MHISMSIEYQLKDKLRDDTASNNKGRLVFLILSSMLIMMGAAAIAPALPAISAHFSDYPETVIAMIITLPPLAIVLTGWLVGIVCDHVRKVRLLIVSLVLFALLGSSGVYISSLEMILAGRALLGIVIAGIMTTTTTLISKYYSDQERIRVLGYQSAAMCIGAIVLDISGGLLASFGWRETFLIYLIALPFIPGVILTMKEPEREGIEFKNANTPGTNDKISGIPLSQISLIYIAAFSVMLIFYTLPTKLPYLLQSGGITSTIISGALLGIPSVFSFFSALSCSKIYIYFKRETIISLGFSLNAIGFLIIGTIANNFFLICGLMLVGIGQGLLYPTLTGWLSHISPANRYGTLFGFYSVFFYLGESLSGFVAQPLIDMNGTYNSVFIFDGIYSIMIAAVFALLVIGAVSHD